MLVRDRSGLEVFMLRRNLRSVFVAGAYVFPGGAVDAQDADPATLAFVDGSDADVADARLGTIDYAWDPKTGAYRLVRADEKWSFAPVAFAAH